MKHIFFGLLLQSCAHVDHGFRLHFADKVKVNSNYRVKDSFFEVTNKQGIVTDFYNGKTRCYPEPMYSVEYSFRTDTDVKQTLEFCSDELIKIGGE